MSGDETTVVGLIMDYRGFLTPLGLIFLLLAYGGIRRRNKTREADHTDEDGNQQ